MQDPWNRLNDDIEGFGGRIDSLGATITAAGYPGIAGASQRVVMFKMMSGVLNQDKFLPIRYMPLTIELELVSSMTDVLLYPSDITTTGEFNTTNSSGSWIIEDVQLKCDVCTLDNALDNEYAQHLLSGKSLPIN